MAIFADVDITVVYSTTVEAVSVLVMLKGCVLSDLADVTHAVQIDDYSEVTEAQLSAVRQNM